MAYTVAAVRKALAPAVLAFGAVVTQWIVTGEFNDAEARTVLAGVVTTLLVFFVPND